MQDILGLTFSQPYIDVFVVTHIAYPISTPIIISSQKTPDEFIDSLTHEIIHRLLSDNMQNVAKTGHILREMLPGESMSCRVHVLVHAVLKTIYVDVLKEPQRLSQDIERCRKFPDYAKAWQIVEEMGSQKIIDDFKKLALVKN